MDPRGGCRLAGDASHTRHSRLELVVTTPGVVDTLDRFGDLRQRVLRPLLGQCDVVSPAVIWRIHEIWNTREALVGVLTL